MAEWDGRDSKRQSVDGRTSIDGFNHTAPHDSYNSTWTQFSGMPPHNVSETAGTFAWDVFTPGSSPYSASLTEMNTQEFISNYQNLISGVGSSPREVLPPVDGRSNTPQDVVQEGKDLYADALENWSSFSPYDPFGTPESPLTSVQSSDLEKGSSSASGNRPTYSDIAKSLKNKTLPQPTSREETDLCKKRSLDSPYGHPVKPFKPITQRRSQRHSFRGQGNTDDMESKVLPDSKYGLDQFEEVNMESEESKRSVSMENIHMPLLTRKGSTSSVSSSTSGIEEIHLTSPRPTSKLEEVQHTRVRLPPDGADANDTKTSTTKPFFDARRIFQNREKKSTSYSNASNATMLNNGKPASGTKAGSTAHRKTTDYINNDLRDSKKKTNQNVQSRHVDGKKHENFTQNGRSDRKCKQSSSHTQESEESTTRNSRNRMHMFSYSTFDQERIDEWISQGCDKVGHLISSFWSWLVTIILLLFAVIVYLVNALVHCLCYVWSKISYFVKTHILKRYFPDNGKWRQGTNRKIGLDENITLPSTGEEAMQRLLACKGKDPYSILGLRSDANDEDIRKYYRKQAILVHPDKNKQPGAEEAFKILGRAFEVIGEPEKRKNYDFEASDLETVMKDLLTKLQEAANMMRCDNCGGKHKRIPVERPWYSARFCKRCNIRHSAKEGDVWAETSMFGFLWHYYACMEGHIYDITEWVACKKEFFKHMQASAHHVFYRIATEGSRGNNNQQRSGEADLEDFINHLFHQAMHTDSGSSAGSNQWQQPQSHQQPQSGQNWNSSSAGTKKGRRRKRKH